MTVAGAEARPLASPLAAQAVALARRTSELAREAGREDLLPDLTRALESRGATRVTVVVCGERDGGKRTLINALLDRPALLPADDDAASATHLVIRGVLPGEAERLLAHPLQGEPVELPVDELADASSEATVTERGIRYLELALEHPLLDAGLVLVDTPSLGGLARAHGLAVLSSLSGADAALVVVDGGSPISVLELEFVRQAAGRVDDVVLVLDRNDRQHGWQEVARETQEHLSRQPELRGRSAVIPTCARMKLRADRRSARDGGGDLAAELIRSSGVPDIAARLQRLAAERAGALLAARVTRLADAVLERFAAREQELSRGAERTTDELRVRLRSRERAKQDFARDLPTLRRRLNNELRLVQKEADAATVTRLNTLRRSFDKRLAEGEKGDIAEDLEAELLRALEESLADVRRRMENCSAEFAALLMAHGAELELAPSSLDPGAAPQLAAVELQPSATGRGEWLSRAPFAVGALVLNPVYAVVAVAGILFDRHRVHKRSHREQLTRQLAETVNEARGQLSVAVHHALVNGQAALTEGFEEVSVRRRDELEEEIAAVKAQVSLSEAERSRSAAQAKARLARIEDLRGRVLETRRGAIGALQGGSSRGVTEARA
jgi:hypothetical protein